MFASVHQQASMRPQLAQTESLCTTFIHTNDTVTSIERSGTHLIDAHTLTHQQRQGCAFTSIHLHMRPTPCVLEQRKSVQ